MQIPINKVCFKVLFSLGLFCCACVRHGPSSKESALSASAVPTSVPTLASTNLRVGLVLDKGGKDDKSFNSGAYEGAMRAAREFGVKVKTVESSDDAAFEPALRAFAERGFALIVSIGFAQGDAVQKVAAEFPGVRFAIVDGRVNLPNVSSLLFAEHEGSYMVGYAAGLATKTGKIGFVGGMEIPMIRRFEMGYEAGAKAAHPSIQVFVNFVGINSSAWANPARGKELALGQYERGADIVFHAAGASGAGVFDAAEEKRALSIGVDSNQNCVKPGRVLTSMLKRVDVAVYDAIEGVVRGKRLSGVRSFGLVDRGVDYSVDGCNESLIGPYRAKLETARASVVAGRVKVPDYYELNKIK